MTDWCTAALQHNLPHHHCSIEKVPRNIFPDFPPASCPKPCLRNIRALLATPICVLPCMIQHEHGECARLRQTGNANGLSINLFAVRVRFGQARLIHPFAYIQFIVSAYADSGSSRSNAI